jgi:hypothetical protein
MKGNPQGVTSATQDWRQETLKKHLLVCLAPVDRPIGIERLFSSRTQGRYGRGHITGKIMLESTTLKLVLDAKVGIVIVRNAGIYTGIEIEIKRGRLGCFLNDDLRRPREGITLQALLICGVGTYQPICSDYGM